MSKVVKSALIIVAIVLVIACVVTFFYITAGTRPLRTFDPNSSEKPPTIDTDLCRKNGGRVDVSYVLVPLGKSFMTLAVTQCVALSGNVH